MKKHWALYILGICILQTSVAGMVVSAKDYREDAYKQQAGARKEEGKAAVDKVVARVDSRAGHSLRASLRTDRAAREQKRARKHLVEARDDRAIAKHQYR